MVNLELWYRQVSQSENVFHDLIRNYLGFELSFEMYVTHLENCWNDEPRNMYSTYQRSLIQAGMYIADLFQKKYLAYFNPK